MVFGGSQVVFLEVVGVDHDAVAPGFDEGLNDQVQIGPSSNREEAFGRDIGMGLEACAQTGGKN